MYRIDRTIALFLILCSTAAMTHGQESVNDRELQTEVVTVSHTDARNLAQSILQLQYPISISAPDATRIILQGTAIDIRRTADLIAKLDLPGVAAGAEHQVAYIPFGTDVPANLMALVETVAPSGFGTAYAWDEFNGMLVARSDEKTIQRVRELVKAVDRPARGLTLEFSFIKGFMKGKPGTDEADLPAALKPVGDTLRANGLHQLSALPPILVHAHEGQAFETESVLGTGSETPPVKFHVEGTAQRVSHSDRIELEIQAAVFAENGRTFRTETTVACKLGAYTILAAAPASVGESNAIALAIRVSSND